MTHYLRFPDETAALAAIEAAGFAATNDNGTISIIRDTHDYSLDPVGILYNNDALIDLETGAIISSATPMKGWHINYIGTLPEGWDNYLTTPRNPRRMFA